MKKKFLQGGALIFTLVIGSVFLSSPSHAFWWGDQLGPAIGPVEQENLTVALEGIPATDTDPAVPGAIGWMILANFGVGVAEYPESGTIYWDHEKAWAGYTLLSLLASYCPKGYNDDGTANCDMENFDDWWYAVLIDMHGNIIHGWPGNPFPGKLVEGGDILMAKGLQEECYQSPRFVQMDWCGNENWEWINQDRWPCDPPPPGVDYNPRCVEEDDDGIYYARTGQHHDWQREGNPVGYYAPGMMPKKEGKTLILSSTVPPLDETCPDPADTENCISEYRLISDSIYEVDSTTGIRTWEWHDHKHFDKDRDCDGRPGCLGMGFDKVEKESILKTRAFIPNEQNASDYHHTNSASWLGPNKWYSYYGDERFHPDNIIWDGRQSNITAIIARHDHPDGVTHKAGDIVWRIGPDYGPAQPEGKLGWIIGQHMAHMIPYGLPGAGNILIYDNGGMAGWGAYFEGSPVPAGYATLPFPLPFGQSLHMGTKFRNYSRVIEFDPIHFKMVWEYKKVVPHNANGLGVPYERNMFSSFISGAQRLYNGNTLITEGGPGRLIEVTQHGDIVWEYVQPEYPVYGPVQGPGGGGGPAVYRAYRVPPQMIPRHLLRDRDHDGTYDVCQSH